MFDDLVLDANHNGPCFKCKTRPEKMAFAITNGEFNNFDAIDLRLGCYVASGALSQHPMIQGILVAIVEKVSRASRGVHSFKGLRLEPKENALLPEAGITVTWVNICYLPTTIPGIYCLLYQPASFR